MWPLKQYIAEIYSPVTILGVGTALSRSHGQNLGYDYGGRLVAAWLDR